MNVSCPHCGTAFRVDPANVPTGGARARCSRCAGIFSVQRADASQSVSRPDTPVTTPVSAPPATPAPPAVEPPAPLGPPVFGAADPHSRARRLARALISDIVVYYPDRRERGLRDGSLRQEFHEEIRKSWDEYSSQVGDQLARGTPYFREALNEILARGEPVF